MAYSITAENDLIRRIPQQPPFFKLNERGETVLSSAAYELKKDEDGLSVDIAALTTLQAAVFSHTTLTGGAVTGALLVADVPMSLGCTCEHNPVPGNGAHALIKGNFTKSLRRKLAAASRLL